jgi:diguanylate cyclase (GGDEF)-like protein
VSFRSRLLVFFTIIVVVPMIAVALVLFALTQDSERGKADARLAGGVRTALSLYDERRDDAREELARVATDNQLAGALRSGNRSRIADELIRLLQQTPGVESIAYYDAPGQLRAFAGSPAAVAAATAAPTTRTGKRLGTLGLSVTPARQYVGDVKSLTGLEVRVRRRARPLASTIAGVRDAGFESGDVDLGGDEYRARVQTIREGAGDATEVQVLQDASELQSSISNSRLLIGGILLAFLILSLFSSVFVVRALQGQIDNFLQAARRLGRGDFSEPVPVQGDDEFAALGQEFNTMAEQLEAQIEEVERKRRELEDSIRRIGEAFETGLDRQGLVDLALRTAVEACDAQAGRILPVDERDLEEVRIVSDPELLKVIEVVERQVLAAGANAPLRASLGDSYALSMPLLARRGGEGDLETIGAVSIARRGGDFTEEQRELFTYLTGQAAVSIENADLHRKIQRQAITDELTGLSNVRHFHELLDTEIERAQRFNNHIGLVMVDIDNFKKVNDTYGHPQGDLVLKEIARVLQEQSRDIDFPARYGGEEMSVILPQTDIAGAEQLAERMREAIEALEVKRLDGQGVLKMTASFGVAALPATATDKRFLISSADEALYRAKHGGKNRVERATATPEADQGSR